LSGADANDPTFVQNAGTGVNMAARALDLQPGDDCSRPISNTEP
jgi:hypothetical protein